MTTRSPALRQSCISSTYSPPKYFPLFQADPYHKSSLDTGAKERTNRKANSPPWPRRGVRLFVSSFLTYVLRQSKHHHRIGGDRRHVLLSILSSIRYRIRIHISFELGHPEFLAAPGIERAEAAVGGG